jgi:hypothetical protein
VRVSYTQQCTCVPLVPRPPDSAAYGIRNEGSLYGRCRSRWAVSATLTFAVALAMRGTGACLADFYFVVPRQKTKKTEIPFSVRSSRINCARFLAVENDDSSTQSSPGRVKRQAPVEAVWLRT